MTSVLIDQEGLRRAAHEMRAIDRDLDGVRSRLRGAATGFMPPEVIAQIASTAAHTEPRLWWHGECLRLEALRLEWRAAVVEADLSDPRLRSSFDFLDRAGLLGLAGLAGLLVTDGGLASVLRTVAGGADVAADALQQALYPRRLGPAPMRELWRLAGNRGGNRAAAFGRYAVRYSSLAGKPLTKLGSINVPPRAVEHLGKGVKVLGAGAKAVGPAFTFHDVYSERMDAGQSRTEAGSAATVVAGSTLLLTIIGTVAGGPVGGIVLGAVGGYVGEKAGHGLLHVSDKVSDALVDPYIAVSGTLDDAGDALIDRVKFW